MIFMFLAQQCAKKSFGTSSHQNALVFSWFSIRDSPNQIPPFTNRPCGTTASKTAAKEAKCVGVNFTLSNEQKTADANVKSETDLVEKGIWLRINRGYKYYIYIYILYIIIISYNII